MPTSSTSVYTGVGARESPRWALEWLRAIAGELARSGWTGRTGGARGADEAIAAGHTGARGAILGGLELYLPSPGWRGWRDATLEQPTEGAYELAFELLGVRQWTKLDPFGMRAHARNMHEVLGPDLRDPSRFVICYTPGGRDVGGTRSAIRCARIHGVPVLNLGRIGSTPKPWQIANMRCRVESWLQALGVR